MADVAQFLASVQAGLTFYRQHRADGGTRTGIMVGESTVLGLFEEGDEEYDPSLLWSIDVRCSGPSLPNTADDARAWLASVGPTIKAGLSLFADNLRVGSDPTGAYLIQWSNFPGAPADVSIKAFCGALRRVDALSLGDQIKNLRDEWDQLLSRLVPTEPSLL